MSALDALSATSAAAAAAGGSAARAEAGSAERFLKLLVAQMQNQDPLNPLDNAQVTSQIAQINTVAGIDKLNQTMEGLNGHFLQMQTLQGAALVGRDVVVEGNRLSSRDGGPAQGGFELATAADRVTVEILNGAGVVIDSVDLGAQGDGRHGFAWAPPAGVDGGAAHSFRIVARAGAAPVAALPMMRDHVDAVATGGDGLNLELRLSGSVPYGRIKAFN
jgi:flagellar basal-body rod modification protein FlgD